MDVSISQKLRFPALCMVCERYHNNPLTAVCDGCLKLMPRIEHPCRSCAYPLLDDSLLLCGACIRKKPSVDNVSIAYLFAEPLRTLLHDFKYREALYLKDFLTHLMRQHLPSWALQTECLIPIPMHSKRIRKRGFNHAVELAKCLASALKIPINLTLCKKIIHTLPQMGLDIKKRHTNLRHAFAAGPIKYHHITLIDDLLTTGSTVNEVAKTLKKQGVLRVDVWCCARATKETLQ